ncbi:MAG: putative capsular polysaccharide synthesis family protein, partial [Nitrososphaera sp.]|nr:putative capsular polysaccharide synthesis family protein [Nitrososphaera sp.]
MRAQVLLGIKSVIRKLVWCCPYPIAESLYHFSFSLNSAGKTPVLVYQMGKVGSTSVCTSLLKARPEMPFHHIHVLTDKGIAWEEATRFGQKRGWFRKSSLPINQPSMHSKYLAKQWARDKCRKPWKVITLTRDPIARNVSSLFETIERWIPDFAERCANNDLDLAQLSEFYLAEFHQKLDYYEMPFQWFHVELEQFFGIDILESEFPRTTGYKIYSGNGVELLLIKLEYLDRCFTEAIKKFLGIDIPLVNARMAADKSYYPVYKVFLQSLRLPDDYIKKMYACEYVRHLYSDS